MALPNYIIKMVDAKMGQPNNNLHLQTGYNDTNISSGTTVLRVKGKNITVPGYFAQRFEIEYSKYKSEPTPAKLEALQKSIKNTYKNLGYSTDEITRIANEFK